MWLRQNDDDAILASTFIDRAHAGGVTHRNGMRAPGGDEGRLGCLPTVRIGVTGCKLRPWRGFFTTPPPIRTKFTRAYRGAEVRERRGQGREQWRI